MRSVYFRVPGEPVAKERPRTFVDGTGKTRTITPRKTQAAEQMIGYEFRRQYPGFGEPIPHPVSVRLVFHTMSKAKDADNLTKTCLDALQGVVFANDRQVDEIWAKVIRGKGNPETIIEVSWRRGGMTGSEWLEMVRTVCVTVFGTGLVWAVAWVIRG